MSEYVWVVRDLGGYAADWCDSEDEAFDSAVYHNWKFVEYAPFSVHREVRVHEFDPRGE